MKKKHLYYYHKSLYKTYEYFVKKQRREPLKYYDYDFYVTLIDNLSEFGYYSYYYMHSFRVERIIFKFFYFFYERLTKRKSEKDPLIIIWLAKIIVFSLKLLPYILLIFLFFYDVIYNNYKLYLIFYYLPFFFFYQIWKYICFFLEKKNGLLDQIIYNFYYESNKIYYIDLLDVEYDFILTYMKNNFVCYTNIYKKKNKKNLEEIFLDNRYCNYILECSQGIQKQMYILSEKEKNKIINPYTGDEIELQDVETIENWPLIRRRKKNNENKVESLPFLDFESFIKEKK